MQFIYRAKNQFGSVYHNYSLEVRLTMTGSQSHVGGPLAVVTGVTPANSTLFIGQSSELTCTVKSQERPHIKWFKQVSREVPTLTITYFFNFTSFQNPYSSVSTLHIFLQFPVGLNSFGPISIYCNQLF